jgi:hypothetical protein
VLTETPKILEKSPTAAAAVAVTPRALAEVLDLMLSSNLS